MKVVNIVTRDDGGGGRSAYRLHAGLNQIGVDSTLYVSSQHNRDEKTVVFKPSKRFSARVRRYVKGAENAWAAFGFNKKIASDKSAWALDQQCWRGAEPLTQLPEADVYNLHTINNFFDFDAFFPQVPMRTPVVWTLHVLEAFTGGCQYTRGCRGFEKACGCCPILGSNRENDPSRFVWKKKKALYEKVPRGRVHVVSPSRWLAEEAGRSSLMGEWPISVIPYGIDTAAYSPRGMRTSREILGLPDQAKVVLFCSNFHERKGLEYVLQTLRRLAHLPDLHLVVLGSDFTPAKGEPFVFHHFGSVTNDRLLSLFYSAADVVIVASKEDNLPNVVLESMGCGTPVVGFGVGGIVDMIRPDFNGALAPFGDVETMTKEVERILGDPGHREKLSSNCRQTVVQEYASRVQAERYLALYKQISGIQ